MLLLLFYFNDLLHFNIPLITDVFLFSNSFLHFSQMSKSVLQPLNFTQGHVCITTVKTSNVFYLHLLWHKSLFQLATRCANTYRVFKNMFHLQTLTNKTPVCKSNLCQQSWWENFRYTWLQKTFKKNFMAPIYGWGSTASRLEPLRGGSLLFTTKFPEILGNHFISLGRMKDWADLRAT